jgi:DNA-binding GntR family transcriptional regulator
MAAVAKVDAAGELFRFFEKFPLNLSPVWKKAINKALTDASRNLYTGFMIQHTTSRRRRGGATSAKLAQRAYEHLQGRLWSGALAAGSKISETTLAQELGMSRTPVREAIRRLESEGVVSPVASSGTFVTVPERTEIVEAYEVRMAIENFAVQKATRRMKPAQVLALQKTCDQMLTALRDFRKSRTAVMTGSVLRRYLDADLAFHLLLLQAAENRRALTIFGDVNLRSAIFGCRSHQRDLHHVAWVWLQHARVARAVRQRNPKVAQRYLERHMQASMAAALEAYDAQCAGRRAPSAHTPHLTAAMTELLKELRTQPPSRKPNI